MGVGNKNDAGLAAGCVSLGTEVKIKVMERFRENQSACNGMVASPVCDLLVLAAEVGGSVAKLIEASSRKGRQVRVVGTSADAMGAVVAGETHGVVVVEGAGEAAYKQELVAAVQEYYPQLTCVRYVVGDGGAVGRLCEIEAPAEQNMHAQIVGAGTLRFVDYAKQMQHADHAAQRNTNPAMPNHAETKPAQAGGLLRRRGLTQGSAAAVADELVADEMLAGQDRDAALEQMFGGTNPSSADNGPSLTEAELAMLLGDPEQTE